MRLAKVYQQYRIYSWTLAIIAVRVFVQLLFVEEYGIFIDEYYYLASTKHLALGYVDHPPLSIWLLAAVERLLGDSATAIRIPAILAGAALVFTTAAIARGLGAGTFGVSLGALLVAFVPVYIGMGKFYSMNSLDLLFWNLAILVLLLIFRIGPDATPPPTGKWLLLGLILGFGLLNKHSLLFLGFALAVSLLMTPSRRFLKTAGPYLTGALALAILGPNLVWQFQQGWPTLEFMQNARLHKNFFSFQGFLVGQLLELHPFFFPIWMIGLVSLLGQRTMARFRPLGFVYLVLLGLFLAIKAKTYYLAPIYPVLLAAGATQIERWTQANDSKWNGSNRTVAASRSGKLALRVICVVGLTAAGALILPMSLPVLKPETYIAYERALGIAPPQMEKNAVGRLPQHFADMFGWQELRRDVGKVFRTLPPGEQSRAVILAGNYGFAGALQYRQSEQGLPGVGSGHNSYYAWGPPKTISGGVPSLVIAVGIERRTLEPYCGQLELAATSECRYCLTRRQTTDIWICRQLRQPIAELWPRFKRYI